MKQLLKRLLALCLMVALLGTLVLQAAPIAQAVDYLTTLPQLHYGDYGTVNIVHDQGNCYSMQGVATDADYTYCAKIGSNDAVACIVRLAKADGAKTIMTNAANGGYYFYNLGHANALDIVKINGVQQMFVTGGANLVRLTMNGTTLTTAGTYTFSYNGATTNTTAVQIMYASSKEVKVITKGGKSLYTGTLDPTASSGNIELTHLCNLDVANIRLKGEIHDYSTFVQQGFDYRDGKVFVPLSGNAYVETINESIVAVYDVEGASGTVYNDPTLSFRVISGQYAGLFEIEDVEVCDYDGKLYFSSNRRKTESDTNYDGVSFFAGYVYDPSMSTTGPADYRWETVNNQWITVTDGGNTFNNPIRISGYMTDNTMAESMYYMRRGVVLKHDKPWVLEWKSSGSFGGGGMLLSGGRTSYTTNEPYVFRFKNSTFIAMGYYDGKQNNNYGIKLSDYGINGIEEHVYRLTNKIAADGSNMVYLSIDGKELGALNNHYVGLSDQNTKVDWVNGKDLTFNFQGTINNPLDQCKLDYLQVWADGVPAEPSNAYRWETKNDDLTPVSDSGYTQNTPVIYNGSVSGTTYNKACFRLSQPVKLMHDREWSVEWQSEGETSNVFLLSAAEGGRNPHAPFLFRFHTNLIFLGAHDGTHHANCGINLDDYGIDGTAKHTYRLINKVASDGSNMVYLYVDGSEIGPMNNAYSGTTNLNTTSDWLNGKDLVFDYVGNRSYSMSGEYTYLQVLEDRCEHSYASKVTTAATCTASGIKTYTCSYCGYQYTETIPAGGHSYSSKVTAATCTGKGYTTYTCKTCGDTYKANETAALGHKYTSVITTAPGCDSAGVKTYTCKTCGDSYTESLAATGHNYTAKVTAPTCTSGGYTTYTCSICGGSYTGNNTAARGHDYKATVIDPTCTTGGYTTYRCSTCGDTYQSDITAPMGHNYKSVVTKPTCTAQGYTTYTCNTCGASYKDNYTAASGHHYNAVVTKPTCTAGGYTTYTCSCGHSYQDDITNPTGHSFKTVTVAATCTKDGSVTDTCSNCGEKEIEIIPAIGHRYSSKVTAPTCTDKGYTTYTCSNCGNSYKADEKAALGHQYETVITTVPGCSSAGVKTHTCKTCGDSYTESLASTGHNYTAKVTAPTCTEKGYTTYTCPCGDTYIADEVAALGHKCENVTVVAPSCIIPGYNAHTCDRCGYSYYDSIVPALGHRYKATVTEPTYNSCGYTTYTCDLCGHSYKDQITNPIGHNYEIKMISSTCTTVGYTLYTCNCGYSYTTDEVAALGHSYENGICVTCGEADPDYVSPIVQPTLKLKAPALEFKDMVKVVAFFTAENLDDVVEMGMLTYTEKVDVVDVNTAAYVIPGADFDESSGRYFANSQGIHGKFLGDTVYLACYAKLSDGTYAYTKLASYSPVQYATNQLKGTDMKLKQLCAAMLNYGAAAQNYFGYNTDVLANSTLTAEQIALPDAYTSDMVGTVPAAPKDKQGAFASNKGFGTRKPAVSFEGAFSINYFFTPTYTPENGITLYYWTEADYNAADVLTVENATGAVAMTDEGSQFRGDIEGIAAKDLAKAIYVAAVYSDGSTTWTSGVLGYSIGAYCSSQATGTGTMAELAKATAVYGYHAKQYFG